MADFEHEIADRLRREGYSITRQKRTWLGRIRFEASNGSSRREVVLDPSSGEILRDYTEGPGRNDSRTASSGSSGEGGGSSAGESPGGETPGGESPGSDGGGKEPEKGSGTGSGRGKEKGGESDAPK